MKIKFVSLFALIYALSLPVKAAQNLSTFGSVFNSPATFGQDANQEELKRKIKEAQRDIAELEKQLNKIRKDKPSLNTPSKTPEQVAIEFLSTVKRLPIQQKDIKGMGFKSKAEFDSAKLGEMIVALEVDQKLLARYKKGDDPTKLIKPNDQRYYMVEANGVNRARMTVIWRHRKWNPFYFGYDGIYEDLKTVINQRRKRKEESVTYLTVEGRTLDFVSINANDPAKFQLIPFADNAKLGWKAGQLMPAAQVFEKFAGE